MNTKSIPITVFTGFLGAGKTTVILSLLSKLPKGYRAVLLKNEFGDVAVDSQLATQSSLAAVNEISNGCMCCVLVGQMKTAILEIGDKFSPDRIIIECSGSAFPATLAFQIRELERETNNALKLDAIVTVIDAENFTGYEDTSPTARMQSQYTDLLVINKWPLVSERDLDIVIDHLNTLNDTTPKVRTTPAGGVDADVVFGLDSKLFLERDLGLEKLDKSHHDEVETATVYRGALPHGSSANESGHVQDGHCQHCPGSISSGPVTQHVEPTEKLRSVDEGILSAALGALSKEIIWRVKGFIRLSNGLHILNWTFGRHELIPVVGQADGASEGMNRVLVQLTVMGERGEVKHAARKLASGLGAQLA